MAIETVHDMKTLICFIDTLKLTYNGNSAGSISVPLLHKGIAWPTDKSAKFQNPDYTGSLCDAEGNLIHLRSV